MRHFRLLLNPTAWWRKPPPPAPGEAAPAAPAPVARDAPSPPRRASTLSKLAHSLRTTQAAIRRNVRAGSHGAGEPAKARVASEPPSLPPVPSDLGAFGGDLLAEIEKLAGEIAASPAASAAPSRAASASGSRPAASSAGGDRQRPVVNADGSIDYGQLQAFADRLADITPAVDDGFGSKPRRQYEKLRDELAALATQGPSGQPEAQTLLRVRDRMASASARARDLSRTLSRPPARARAARSGNAQRRAALASTFACLAALLTELKRIHLTTAAPAVMHEYAQREEANLLDAVPGLAVHSNSQLATDTAVRVGYESGVAKGDLSAHTGGIVLLDDDRDMNFWTISGAGMRAGPSAWPVSLTGTLGFDAGGVYYETETIEDLLALMVNRRANRAIWQSASPSARATGTRVRRAGSTLARALGVRRHVPRPDVPLYLSDRKLAKGFAPAVLHHLGAEFGRLTEDGAFASAVEAAYPAPADRLAGPGSGAGYREPLNATVPLSDPLGDGVAPFRDYQTAVTADIGDSTGLETGVAATGALSGAVRANIAEFHLRNVEPSHRLLDPSYHADMAQTLLLHAQVEAVADDPGGGRFWAWRQVREELGRDAPEHHAFVDAAYYGPWERIPRQFRDSVATADVSVLRERLTAIDASLDRMRERYLAFVRQAAVLSVKTGKSLPPAVREGLEASRLEAAGTIEALAWGRDDPGAGAGYPGGPKAAARDPAAFISATHDALGLALACLGTHLSIVKRRLVQLTANDGAARPQLAEAMQAADARYAEVHELMQKTFLPLKREQVFLRNGSFEDKGLSQRCNLNVVVSGGGGVKFDLGALMPKPARPGGLEYSVDNQAGQVSATVRVRRQLARYQINPSRQGEFYEFRFQAAGGQPLTGAIMAEGIMRVLRRRHPELDLVGTHAGLTDQLQGALWESVGETGVVIRLRRFPDSRAGFLLQFVRLLQIQRGGPALNATVPSPFGVFRARVSHQDYRQNIAEEVLGPDIGYLVLQHGKLTSLLDAAEAAGGDNEALAAAFRGEGRERNGPVVARSYFGNRTMIPAVLDSYKTYLTAQEQSPQADGRAAGGTAGADNEFFRYFEREGAAEPMGRVARIAREARHFSPGALAAPGADPYRIPPPARSPSTLPPQLEGEAWEAEKAHIASLKRLDERIAYYCSERGRPVLDAFVRVVSATKEVHNASRHRTVETTYGFRTRLGDKRLRASAKRRLAEAQA